MDYCKKCKSQTRSIGIPEFIQKNNKYRRLSICRKCNTKKNNISKSPEDIEVNELFKPARKHFETRHFTQRGINDTWQADLYCFYRPKSKNSDPDYNLRNKHNEIKDNDNHKALYKANNGFKYILFIIDTFSKFVYYAPLKTKSGLEVSEAFSQIFKHNAPKKLHVDKGREFYNKDLKQILNKYNITMYSTGTDKKASIIERFNRTFGNEIKKVFYRNKDKVWISELPKIIKTYNNTYHRTIKMKPVDVSKENEEYLLSTVYNYDITNSVPKFEINDRVRLSLISDVYRNKLKSNWSKEIFTVEKVMKSNIVYYKIHDIEHTVYEKELLLSLL